MEKTSAAIRLNFGNLRIFLFPERELAVIEIWESQEGRASSLECSLSGLDRFVDSELAPALDKAMKQR